MDFFKARFNSIKTCRYLRKNYLCVSRVEQTRKRKYVHSKLYIRKQKLLFFTEKKRKMNENSLRIYCEDQLASVSNTNACSFVDRFITKNIYN